MSMSTLPELTLIELKVAAKDFVNRLQLEQISELYGTTDGKAVGTYVEQLFRRYLIDLYSFRQGNSANGIDFPELEVDLKVTSFRQPQSSCPFRDASQKVYGLGYHLLIFVYEKNDDPLSRTAQLNVQHVIFVHKERTADWQTTAGLTEILRRDGNKDDIAAYLEERNFPLDEIGREALAERVLREQPEIGYLTVSNALQWRLQYTRVITIAGTIAGVENLSV